MPMGGWKTWTSGGIAIVTGAIGMVAALTGIDVPAVPETASQAVELIVFGLGLIGLGHKLEKNR